MACSVQGSDDAQGESAVAVTERLALLGGEVEAGVAAGCDVRKHLQERRLVGRR